MLAACRGLLPATRLAAAAAQQHCSAPAASARLAAMSACCSGLITHSRASHGASGRQHGTNGTAEEQSRAGQRQQGTAATQPEAAAAAAGQQPQTVSSPESAAQEAIKVLTACGGAASWSSQGLTPLQAALVAGDKQRALQEAAKVAQTDPVTVRLQHAVGSSSSHSTCWPWDWFGQAEQVVQEVSSQVLPLQQRRAQQQAIWAAANSAKLAVLERQLSLTSQQCDIFGRRYRSSQEQLVAQQEQHEQQLVQVQQQQGRWLRDELERERQRAAGQQRTRDWVKMVVVLVVLVLGVLVREAALLERWQEQQREQMEAKEREVRALRAKLAGMEQEVEGLVASAAGIRPGGRGRGRSR